MHLQVGVQFRREVLRIDDECVRFFGQRVSVCSAHNISDRPECQSTRSEGSGVGGTLEIVRWGGVGWGRITLQLPSILDPAGTYFRARRVECLKNARTTNVLCFRHANLSVSRVLAVVCLLEHGQLALVAPNNLTCALRILGERGVSLAEIPIDGTLAIVD